MKKSSLCLFLVTVAFGCATYRPAVKKEVQNSRKFSMSYDETWKKIVSYATKHGMNIKTIDKASGLIAFERAYDRIASYMYMDCGNADESAISNAFYGPMNSNITVVSESGKETEVTVNLFESLTYPPATPVYQCYSKGIFEKEFFCEVEGHPCPEPVVTPTPKKGAVQYK